MGRPNVFIVSYDISDQKRLYSVHKTMKGFGDAIHYSVFRCLLSEKDKVELIAILTEIIKHDEDRVMIINLGPSNGEVERRIEFMGVRQDINKYASIII